MSTRQNHVISQRAAVVSLHSLVRGLGRQINWDRVPESFRLGSKATVVVGVAGASGSATTVPVAVTFLNGNTVIPAGTTLDFGGGKFARVSVPYTSGANITVDAIPTALVSGDTATYFDPGDAGKKMIPAFTLLCIDGPAMTVVAAAVAGNTGNATIGTVSATYAAMPGLWKLTNVEPVTDNGRIIVENPLGQVVGDAIVGTAATVAGVTFTVTDGSTDMAVGDQFTIEVVQAEADKSGKALPRSTGRGIAIGMLETDAIQDDPSASLTGWGVLVGGVFYENMLPDAVSNELPEAYKDELRDTGAGFVWQRYVDSRTAQVLA